MTQDLEIIDLPEWPDFGLEEDVRPAIAAARAAGRAAALVTLYEVVGGGPRPPGAQMVISDGALSGFLSGGCVEADVALHAARTIADGEPRRLVYGEGGPWPDIRLLCGARIEALVERIAPDDSAIGALLEHAAARRPVLYETDGRRRSVRIEPAGLSECAEWSDAPFRLLRPYAPRPRLAVVGSDPIALAITRLGALAGFETTLIRPRGPERGPDIPGADYVRGGPADELARLAPDAWTAIAVATHDWETDHEALRIALPSAAGYVGVLGARRRLPERIARLRAEGLGEGDIARLRGPIGLDLGGKAPWHVAVAVLAEIIALGWSGSARRAPADGAEASPHVPAAG